MLRSMRGDGCCPVAFRKPWRWRMVMLLRVLAREATGVEAAGGQFSSFIRARVRARQHFLDLVQRLAAEVRRLSSSVSVRWMRSPM